MKISIHRNSFALVFIVIYANILLLPSSISLLFSVQDFVFAADVVSHLAIPIAGFFWLYSRNRHWVNSLSIALRWSSGGVGASVLLGCCFALIFLKASQLSIPSMGIVGAGLPSPFIVSIIERYGFFGILYLSLPTAVLEELLFKNVLMHALGKSVSELQFCLISTLLFVVFHLSQSPFALLTIAGFGLLTASYYYQKRSLLNLIVLHGTADTLIFAYWNSVLF